jgi:ankyrin repeat protein
MNAHAERVCESVRQRFPTLTEITPFHIAAGHGNISVIHALYRSGGDPDLLADGDVSPLQRVAANGSRKAMEFFEKSFTIFQDDGQSYEATKVALASDSVEALAVLQKDDETFIKTHFGTQRTAAHLAAFYGSLRILRYVGARGIDFSLPDDTKKTAFELAVTRNRLSAARYLLEQTDAVDLKVRTSKRWSFLHIAVEGGSVEMASLLISYGAPLEENVSYYGTPLDFAVTKGNIPLTRLLLATGAAITVDTWKTVPKESSALESMLRMYAEQRVRAEQAKETVIHTAIRLGELQFFATVCHRADINQKNAQGMTPLALALDLQKGSCIRMLLEAGATHSPEEDILMDKLLRS